MRTAKDLEDENNGLRTEYDQVFLWNLIYLQVFSFLFFLLMKIKNALSTRVPPSFRMFGLSKMEQV